MCHGLPIYPPLSANILNGATSSGRLNRTLDQNIPINFKDGPPSLLFSEETISDIPISWKQDKLFNPIYALAKKDLVYYLLKISNYKLSCKVICNAESPEPTIDNVGVWGGVLFSLENKTDEATYYKEVYCYVLFRQGG